MKLQNLRVRAYKHATLVARRSSEKSSAWFRRGGQLEFRNGEPWELALDHVAQHRIVRLRAGRRILQFVAEILVGGRQMDQNEADTIDGKIETHFALAAHRGARDGVGRILAELAEVR